MRAEATGLGKGTAEGQFTGAVLSTTCTSTPVGEDRTGWTPVGVA